MARSLAYPSEASLTASVNDHRRCYECANAHAVWSVLDKSERMPLARGCYNTHQFACTRDFVTPDIANTLDGIPPIVYLVSDNQPACFDFTKRRG